MKTLILTEKPSVAMDFAKALNVKQRHDGYIENQDYIITWAVGHLLELFNPDEYDPKWKHWTMDTLPIIPDKFYYKPVKRTKKQLNIVQRLLNQPLDKVVIATDAGREGEVIARTILMFCDFRNPDILKRFWTSQALTPQVVKQGMHSFMPASNYDRLWRAGQARQIADWLVGMSCTRAATIASIQSNVTGKNNLFSVGRVQTAVLSLLTDRRRERENFKPEPYWLIQALFINDKGQWWGHWFNKNKTRFDKEQDANKVMAKINRQTGKVLSVKKQQKNQSPPFLYSLTALQQEANRKFGFSAKITLNIAQNLYEEKKCLSYPRTDSVVLGSKNVSMAKTLINKFIEAYPDIFSGVKYELITASNKRVFNDNKLTDHHALIPLKPISPNADKNEKQIYYLVLKRFAAVFYPDFEFEQTDIITEVEKETFQTKGKRTVNLGWKAVYQNDSVKAENKIKDYDKEPESLPNIVKGDLANVKHANLEKKMTQPRPEYTEALLLKDMTNPGHYVSENNLKKIYRGDVGLGTQATRAQIIETLLTREYVVREKKQLKATDKGCRLIDTLRQFKEAKILASPEETARWEMQLEQIAQGKGSDEEFLDGIKQLVQKIVQEFKTKSGHTEYKILGKCPECMGNIIEGKKGYGCANWRKQDGACRFVVWKNIAQKQISHQMVKNLLEKGKIGPFKDFISKKGKPFTASLKLVYENEKWEAKFDFDNENSKISEPIGKCPDCGGDVIERKKSYGCANWREEDGGCKFTIWKITAQREITRNAATALLENKITDILFGFISRKGNAFSARLKLSKENSDVHKVVFVFD